MRIAVFSTCPRNAFSGGRYHAMMIAHVLARRGHEAYFITNNAPVFQADLAPISADNPVEVILSGDFNVAPRGDFDAVFVAPQMSQMPQLYRGAVRFAKAANAALFLINYEAPNWFNAYSPVKRPEEKWAEWVYLAKQGACILSSAGESDKFAREYYTDIPPQSAFGVWQPAINSVACDAVSGLTREKLVVAFARPSDGHKGGDDLKALLCPELKGHTLGIVIGNPAGAEEFLRDLEAQAKAFDVEVKPFFGVSDEQKFVLLKRAAAVVFPSYFEGYGYPPIEALAADVPCIAYDLPVVRENCGDRIRYAPVGDAAALRRQLVEALAAGPVRTSDDPHVRSLTSVDERGAALEAVIADYAAARAAARSAAAGKSPEIKVTPASVFSVRGRSHVSFVATSTKRLAAAGIRGEGCASARLFPRGWENGVWHYGIFACLEKGVQPDALRRATLRLDLADEAVTAEAPLADLKIERHRLPWQPKRSFRLKKISRSGDGLVLSGWFYPKRAYDGLYALDDDDRIVALETGYRDKSYKSRLPLGIGIYGFSSEPIDQKTFHFAGLRLLAVRDGRVVSQGRVNATDLAASAQSVALVGWPKVDLEAVDGAETAEASRKENEPPRSTINVSLSAVSAVGPTAASPLIRGDSLSTIAKEVLKGGLPNLLRILFAANKSGDKPKWAISECSFIADTGSIFVRGWIADSDKAGIEIWHNGLRITGALRKGLPRADVAKQEFKNTSRIDFGFEFTAPFTGELESDLMIKLLKSGRVIAQKIVHGIKIKQDKAPRVEDCVYDAQWHMLWMRGTVRTSGAALTELEIRSGDKRLGRAVFDEKLQGGDGRFYRWRLESVVDDPVLAGESLTITAKLSDENTYRSSYTVPVFEKWKSGIADPDDLFQFSITGNPQMRSLLLPKSTPPSNTKKVALPPESTPPIDTKKVLFLPESTPPIDTTKVVLLVAHNLNAIERGEKRRVLNAIRRVLNADGQELILLHHSQQPSGCGVPEIGFFDPRLEELSRGVATDGVDPAVLEYAQRMLYGFTFTLNRRPKKWSEMEAQTTDELRKLTVVIDQVKPSLILLWHQWNSLMVLGRAVAEARSIPSAFIHEGMLPGTMTLDAAGMMAESDATGVTLRESDPVNEPFFAQARYVIQEIATKNLDRKPQAGTPGALDILTSLKAKNVKTVLYAGVNDWQSGNLPADHPRARIHSPVYRDSLDGLAALLDVADRQDFVVLYKPHPNLFPRPLDIKHERLVYVREANASDCITAVDVVATLLSSLAYISLAHDVPTVLLGRNTLSGVHAAYELADYDDLDGCLREALSKNRLAVRRIRFESHVAALLKGYLFPYGEKTDFSVLEYQDVVKKMQAIRDGKV